MKGAKLEAPHYAVSPRSDTVSSNAATGYSIGSVGPKSYEVSWLLHSNIKATTNRLPCGSCTPGNGEDVHDGKGDIFHIAPSYIKCQRVSFKFRLFQVVLPRSGISCDFKLGRLLYYADGCEAFRGFTQFLQENVNVL